MGEVYCISQLSGDVHIIPLSSFRTSNIISPKIETQPTQGGKTMKRFAVALSATSLLTVSLAAQTAPERLTTTLSG
jgi:hypothetical protein